MKKLCLLILIVVLTVIMTSPAGARNRRQNKCATIQQGLLTPNGDLVERGRDDWGYNYQCHNFIGWYCDVFRGEESWCDQGDNPSRLYKWWNKQYISNRDCDGDGHLDTHLGFENYLDSGAEYWEIQIYPPGLTIYVDWCASHIVAADSSWHKDNWKWYDEENNYMGEAIGSYFLVAEEYSGETEYTSLPLSRWQERRLVWKIYFQHFMKRR